MKLYVDEFPKSCDECPLRSYMCNSYWCSAYEGDTILFADEVKEANLCPLQSLADYTKQVRKEVCEEIREKLNNLQSPPNYPENDCEYGFESCVYKIEDILDQIQGEDK